MAKKSTAFKYLLIVTIITGTILGKIDVSKNWDDTGFMAGLLFLTSLAASLFLPRFAWLWAIIIGGIVFAFNVYYTENYESFVSIPIAFAGAYTLHLFRKS